MDQTLLEKAKKIKAVVLDGDGVIFTGHVLEGPDGGFGKIRCHADGQGISLLRAAGIQIACVTGESGKNSVFLEKLVEKWNGLPSVKSGKWQPVKVFTGAEKEKKVEIVETWLKESGLTLADCAAMGDDLTDYNLLKKVGFATAPAQAEDIIKEIVQWVAPRRGGDGAIRDLANLVLKAKGIDIPSLSLR